MIRKFIGTIVILAAVVAVAGYFLGWFKISSDDNNLQIQVDKEKIRQDADKAKKAGETITNKVNSK